MTRVRYIVKRRSIEAASRNPYRPRQRHRYGKWVAVRIFPDQQQATDFYERNKGIGLYNWAIFHRGKIIT